MRERGEGRVLAGDALARSVTTAAVVVGGGQGSVAWGHGVGVVVVRGVWGEGAVGVVGGGGGGELVVVVVSVVVLAAAAVREGW